MGANAACLGPSKFSSLIAHDSNFIILGGIARVTSNVAIIWTSYLSFPTSWPPTALLKCTPTFAYSRKPLLRFFPQLPFSMIRRQGILYPAMMSGDQPLSEAK